MLDNELEREPEAPAVLETETTPVRPSPWKAAAELLLQILAALLAVALISTFVCKPMRVKGDSMFPTLYEGDLILVRLAASTPQPGDILVCRTDEDGIMAGRDIVKRCIATAGQTVLVDYENDTVTVDGVVLEEDYINRNVEDPLDSGGRANRIYLVPEGCVFVLGDNRNYSADSRDGTVGMVPEEDILGVLMARIPLGEWFRRN